MCITRTDKILKKLKCRSEDTYFFVVLDVRGQVDDRSESAVVVGLAESGGRPAHRCGDAGQPVLGSLCLFHHAPVLFDSRVLGRRYGGLDARVAGLGGSRAVRGDGRRRRRLVLDGHQRAVVDNGLLGVGPRFGRDRGHGRGGRGHVRRLLLLGDQPVRVAHQGAAHAEVEERAGQQEHGAPPTVLLDRVLGHRGVQERADAGAARPQPGGQRALLVEPVGDAHHRGHVAQAQAQAGQEAEREEHHLDGVGERRDDEAQAGYDAAQYGHLAAAELVDQRAAHRAQDQRHGHEQAADPRGLGLALLELLQELDVQQPEREADAVRDQADHQRREHHHPSPTAVRHLGLARDRRRARQPVLVLHLLVAHETVRRRLHLHRHPFGRARVLGRLQLPAHYPFPVGQLAEQIGQIIVALRFVGGGGGGGGGRRVVGRLHRRLLRRRLCRRHRRRVTSIVVRFHKSARRGRGRTVGRRCARSAVCDNGRSKAGAGRRDNNNGRRNVDKNYCCCRRRNGRNVMMLRRG